MSADRDGHARRFRGALGAFATGVTIVTTRDMDGHDIGLTASSFNSVSLDPPMVLWSLAKSARSLPAFLAASHFAVHVLAADQEELSLRFATRGSEKFSGLDIERGPERVPLLRGCSARFQCRTAFRHEGGDHVIFVGAVEEFEHSDRPPLVFHGGRYALTVQKEPVPAASQDSAEPDSSFSQDFLIYLLGRAQFQLSLSLRRDLDQHGINEAQGFVLSILGVSDDRTVAELDRLLWYTGHRVTYELLASLTAAGFADLHGSYDPHARVTLTEAGRRAVIELVAAAKAVEDHAERNLGAAEARILKRALRAIIRETDPGAPPLIVPSYPE
ncbi:MAG TPA: flavin reductase [Steroidobacteraceae bacterium]|jgi:3-hydroxy-9,10-secoandrosta-1,3,5(10)-triene-9,17-dione monooxygenase reductase component